MESSSEQNFNALYQCHLQHLTLKGLRPKTIEGYARALRRIGKYFNHQVEDLSEAQLLAYFSDLLQTHSWSAVKIDLHALRFFYLHVLHKEWTHLQLIKPPRVKRIPQVLSPQEITLIVQNTKKLSYRVFYFTLYSLGLRLGEGLALQVGDIDSKTMQVLIRDAKGRKDRLVPLPQTTLLVLRRFWAEHRHPVLLFPNRKRGLNAACEATSPLDRGGIQTTLKCVLRDCGIKKTFHLIA